MADNPYAQYATNPYAVYGTPREPSPQTPAQSTGDALQNARTRQQIESQPLQNENTRVNIAQGQTSIQNQHFNQNQSLRQEYNALPEVKNYSAAIQSLGTALKAPDSPQGDLSIVYAFAKAMDPGSVVREGEMDMATATASIPQAYQADVARLTQGKRLPPAVRTGLIEAMRQSVGGLRQNYDQQRGRYEALAQQNGFDPTEIVGHPLYEAYLPAEEAYITAHGGTPRHPGAPVETQPGGRFNDGFGAKGTEVQFNDEADARTRAKRFHDDLYNALQSKQLKTPAQINAWVDQFNQQNGGGFKINWNEKDTRLAIRAAMQGKQFGVETPADPGVQQRVQKYMQEGGGAPSAAVAGAGDAASAGLLPRAGAGLQAVTGALNGEGSFNDLYNVNLDANRGYLDQLQKEHLPSYVAGGIIGSLALPTFGAKSAAEMARVGAGYGGLYGAGQGDSSTSLTDRAANTATGAASGAALGYAIPKGLELGGQAKNALLPGARGRAIDAASEGVTMRQSQIDAAHSASDLGIQMPRFVAGGPTAQRLGALADQSQIGAPIIRRATNAMLDQSEAARNQIATATGGRIMNHEGMGDSVIAGARTSRTALKGGYRRLYDAAESLSGDARVPLPTAKQEVLSQVAELSDTPGGVQPAIAATLKDIAGKMDGDWTPASVRRMRTQLRQRFADSGFDQGDASRRAGLIADAAEKDMIAGLRAANKGDAAGAWQKASQLRAAYQQTVDTVLNPILGINKEKTGPEVARALVSAVKNNPGRFRQFVAQMPAAAANDVRASIIGQMGNPGSGGQDVAGEAFSLAKFLTHWNDLKDVRNQVFDPATVKVLNKLAMVAERAKQAGHVENHSQTGSIGIAMLTAGPAASAPGLLLTGHPGAAAATAATSFILGVAQAGGAKLLASPKYAQWLAGLSSAAMSGNQNAVKSQIGRLSKLAATDPELRAPIESLLKSIANDNAVPSIAASSNPSGDQNQQ